jgi:hypothetical protein
VSDVPFSYEDASAWIGSHPIQDPSKFHRQALKLGPGVIPAMVQVLANGPIEQHTAAGLILSFNGVQVNGHGDSPEDFEYRLTMPNGNRQVVHPVNLNASDFSLESSDTIEPIIEKGFMKRAFLQYLAYLVIAGAFAYLASQTSGTLSVISAALAGLLSLVALWSVLFMSLTELVLRKAKRIGRS